MFTWHNHSEIMNKSQIHLVFEAFFLILEEDTFVRSILCQEAEMLSCD